jgi:hypothetical protein
VKNRSAIYVGCIFMWVSVSLGQSLDSPTTTTVCELVQSPLKFSGKIVKLNGRVLIAFEDFELSTAGCEGKEINGVWLEYGRGPRKQPTTWCCGDLVPRDPLGLVSNEDFRRFDRYLTAPTRTKYQVTAALIGRFDAMPGEPGRNGKGVCCTGGFGHFGSFCGRLVIASVANVVATSRSEVGE